MGKIFNINTTTIIILLIALLCFCGSTSADMQEAELFEKAYEYYLAFNPEKALETFDIFTRQFPDSSATDSVYFWRAKSLVHLNRTEEAAYIFRKLREVFPESSYSIFAEKELEIIKNRPLHVDGSASESGKTAKISNNNMSGSGERLEKLESEKIALENKLSDAEKEKQHAEKVATKALADINTVAAQLEVSQKKQEELAKVSAEREKELARLSAGNAELEARLADTARRQGDADLALKKSIEERQAVEASLKEQQAGLVKSQETIALLESALKGSEQDKAKQLQDQEVLEAKSRDALAQLEGSQKKQEELAKVSAEREKELARLSAGKAELEARLADTARRQGDADLALKKSIEERQAVEVRLKEQQAGLVKSQDTIALLESFLKGSEQDKAKQLQDQEVLEAKSRDALAQLEASQKKQEEQARVLEANEKELAGLRAGQAELVRELSSLKARFLEFDTPVLRLGKKQFSLAEILRTIRITRNLADKLQTENVAWRTGNIVDDFIAEQILANVAMEENLTADASVVDSLVRQYALTREEAAYLADYLAVDTLVNIKFPGPTVTKNEAQQYYDLHRDQYIYRSENQIRMLRINYGTVDELEKSLLAVEIQQEALEGKSFDVIAQERSDVAKIEDMPLSGQPDWVRIKLAGLKEGAISTIILSDNAFMIFQAILPKSSYLSFEEVRSDIEKRLYAEKPGQKETLRNWLNLQKANVEFLRLRN